MPFDRGEQELNRRAELWVNGKLAEGEPPIFIVVVSGLPNAGKTQLARELKDSLEEKKGASVLVIPLNGLEERDVAGAKQLIERLRKDDPDYRFVVVVQTPVHVIPGLRSLHNTKTLKSFGKIADQHVHIFNPNTTSVEPAELAPFDLVIVNADAKRK